MQRLDFLLGSSFLLSRASWMGCKLRCPTCTDHAMGTSPGQSIRCSLLGRWVWTKLAQGWTRQYELLPAALVSVVSETYFFKLFFSTSELWPPGVLQQIRQILLKLFRVSVCCLHPQSPNWFTVESQERGSENLGVWVLCQKGECQLRSLGCFY